LARRIRLVKPVQKALAPRLFARFRSKPAIGRTNPKSQPDLAVKKSAPKSATKVRQRLRSQPVKHA
jgi:hypothetical protein